MKLKLPKLPFANPVRLTKIHKNLFGKRSGKKLNRKTVLKIFLWGLGGFVLLVIILFAWYSKDLPTPGKIKNLTSGGSTRLYDRNMNELYTISGEKKQIQIDSKDIPESMKWATVDLEDKDFYHHPGVDPRSILRAAITGVGGGSTLTQQLVKNTLLNDQHSYSRKIKEAILAIELEILYSKDQILTMYLDSVPYGGNNYGIEAASKSYFNKSVKDLSLTEQATLAALPQAPSTLSPYGTHTDRLVERRNKCLKSMLAQGHITQAQYDTSVAEALVVQPRKDSIVAPHFVLYVKDWLVNYFTDQLKDAQLAEQKVEEGGLTVVTTLDLPTQKIAEQAVSDNVARLTKYKASNAGLVSVDPTRGEIMAMVGSVDYFKEGYGSYNVTTAQRQPGSSIKPLIYATAFKDKYNPASILFDLRTDFGNYTPNNYNGNFNGPVSIRYALGNSLNIPAVKTLALVGIDKALQTASDMGITTLTDKDRYGLALVLGGGEVKPLEMAAAYGVFANAGTYMPTTPVLEIKDNKSEIIYSHREPKDGKIALDPQAAYEVTNILSDLNAKKPTFSGMLTTLSLGDRPAAVKTGTTNEYRDAWTIGYTPQLSTAVWAGNNDNTPMTVSGGSVAAAPIWHDFMTKALANQPKTPFVMPDGIKEVTVDRLSNKLPNSMSEPVKDIFASWQVPTETDDVHVQVRVCRENGLPADSSIPDSLIELKTYANVHSEMPNNPKWEGPVSAWARDHGLYNPAPSGKCEANSASPTVSITAPVNNSTVGGEFTITASGSAPTGISNVEFYIDNVSIGTATSSPYQKTYNTSNLSAGSHTIKAVLVSTNGATASDSVTVTVGKDTTPPGEVTSLNASSSGAGKINLTWGNPADSDFAGVNIYIYFDPSGTLAQKVNLSASYTSTQITGLAAGSYAVTIKTVDSSGNESTGSTAILTVS